MIFTIPIHHSLKKGGPFIGPKGGKWADAKMTIPWKEGGEKRTKKVEVETEKRTAKLDEAKKERRKAEPEDGKNAKKKKEFIIPVNGGSDTETSTYSSDDKKNKKALPGTQLPHEVLKKLLDLKVSKLPQGTIPASDVRVDLDGNVDTHAIISWKDVKGKIQQGYTPTFHENNAKKKWERIVKFQGNIPSLKSKFDNIVNNQKPGVPLHQAALIAGIIAESGLRPGNMSSVKNHEHYGISTLKKKHVRVDGDTISLEFVGKSGKTNVTEITNPSLAKAMKSYADSKDYDDHLFNPGMAKNMAAGLLDKGMKLKDLRTIKASSTARELINAVALPPPLTGNEKKDKKLLARAMNDVSGKIAGILNNTPAIARASYIHPDIFMKWAVDVAGASPSLMV